jgi:hypothetical protein
MTDGAFFGRRKTTAQRRSDPFPTFDHIAERTHRLLITRGNQVDRVFEYWREAEDELLDQAATRWLRALGRVE